MGYRIQRARSGRDFDQILTLDHQCFSSEDVKIDIASGVWWLVRYDGEPAGFCGVRASSKWFKTGYLCRAGVLERHAGQGLHLRMVRVRERWARANGWTHLVTDTMKDNVRSCNTLIHCRYRVWEPSGKRAWVRDRGALYWKKRIG